MYRYTIQLISFVPIDEGISMVFRVGKHEGFSRWSNSLLLAWWKVRARVDHLCKNLSVSMRLYRNEKDSG